MPGLRQQRPDTLLVIFISRVLETTIPQTSSVQTTKKMLVDLEGESEMLGNQTIYSSAWGSPRRGSVELLCPKLVHDLPARLFSLPLYLPLAMIGNMSVVHSSAPRCLQDLPPGRAAKAGFALAPIPPAPLPPLAAAGLPQPHRHPNCKLAEIALIRAVSQQGQLPELVHAALPRQCQYNRNEQLLPGKCML